MEFKTWTRKSNAIKAVEKALMELPEDFMSDIFITGVEAADVSYGAEPAKFAVKVFVDNGPSDVDALLDALDGKADVQGFGAEPVPAEEQAVKEVNLEELGQFGLGTCDDDAVCPHCGINHKGNGYSKHEPDDRDAAKHDERIWMCLGCGGEWGRSIKRRASSGRNSPYRGSKIFVSGGNDATNPFRPKSKSHAAFDFVQTNPGTKFEDLHSFGVRIRTITECLRKGTMRSTTK